MGLPLLLLVDDSEVVLAYEASVLSAHYALATAANGREGLQKVEALRPAAVLLDLSMPVMTGDEMLAQLQARPELRNLPVIIVSSEVERGQAALGKGAAAFLRKPIKPEELRETIARVLEEGRRRRLQGGMRVMMLDVGPVELGAELEDVESVLMQPAITPLSLGPGYLVGMVDVYGEPVCVLDLARRLGVAHAVPLIDRKLVIVGGETRLALSVDQVHDPIELTPEQVMPSERFAGAGHEPLRGSIRAVVQTRRGHRLVIDPASLVSRAMSRKLSRALHEARTALAPSGGPRR